MQRRNLHSTNRDVIIRDTMGGGRTGVCRLSSAEGVELGGEEAINSRYCRGKHLRGRWPYIEVFNKELHTYIVQND